VMVRGEDGTCCAKVNTAGRLARLLTPDALQGCDASPGHGAQYRTASPGAGSGRKRRRPWRESMSELIIQQRCRDLGAFEVGRVLPFAKRRMVGPFIFFD